MEKPVLKDKYTIDDLLGILTALRAEDGCPWDKVQTHESLKRCMIEEAYEAIDALDCGDDRLFANELGDVLLQVAFHAQIANERGAFNFDDVLFELCTKLITRHTHVFGGDSADNSEDALATWEKNKKKEKNAETSSQVLKEVPHHLPALMRAEKVQKKAASFGAEFPNSDELTDGLREGLLSVGSAEEYRRILFDIVRLGSNLGLTPEIELAAATDEFIKEFEAAENE